MRKSARNSVFVLFIPVCFLLGAAALEQTSGQQGASTMAFTLQSSDFANGADIPKQFTCSGEDRSPALEWKDAPAGTKSFALIADDPDAPVGTWVHWVVFNIPGYTHSLPGGVEKKAQLGDGTKQGQNDFQKTGYNGPCPPPGKPHRYFFKLYALGGELSLGSDAALHGTSNVTKKNLERAMEGDILGHAEWMGLFHR